ncbi:MAG TPA: glycoside hydrolase family 30 beta sandwich domain-containing protein [Prolixibacteraceae bacterium]|nr:glycoside hydrolase family 30 beta sandwich domain-containing protein [Prolixibacteraceae bacterium]
MEKIKTFIIVIALFTSLSGKGIVPSGNQPKKGIAVWMTSSATNVLFQHQKENLVFGKQTNPGETITVDAKKTFQTIDGFGNCLTGGSATLLHKMDAASRKAILKELFATDGNNIGISYLRISIGASDLDPKVFSYDDLPDGETDPAMAKFTLNADRVDLIPVLKEILAINPNIKLMGSPWSAPTWMKTNNNSKGGSLKPEYFDAYATYFVKYIQGMKAEGITIDAITIQNEPLHPGNNPSMYMTAEDQALFIKRSLGPTFKAANITTKIIVYDHNADRPDYPLTILKDPEASKYVDGSAFHLYGGTIDALTPVHDAFPEKNLYFTEQWVGAPGNLAVDLAWHVRTLIIGGTRNWCRTILEWNLAADPNNDPHTIGGCDQCLGTITIDRNKVTRNPAYYILAHAAKFVRPGSVRIDSNLSLTLPNVAFKNPDGKKVLIVQNNSGAKKVFNISFNGKTGSTSLEKDAVGTYIW